MNRLLALLITTIALTASAKVEVTSLRVENIENPLAIDTETPRFSWKILSDQKNVKQTAYQIIVTTAQGEAWNTGKVESDKQLWIPYGGDKLASATQCSWKVKVWTTVGETSWSEEACFGIGLLKESQWSGRWIGLERLLPGEERGLHTRLAARYVRKEFELEKPVRRAIAYVAGIGLHELHVNGTTFDTYVMQPMPTDYRKTVLYNTYDITSALTSNNSPLTSKRKLSYKEKREMEQLEKDIAALEAEQKQIEEALCGVVTSVEEITAMSKRLPLLKDELEEKSMRWLELSEIEN